jgi:iron complex outermembrane receptor protein
VAQNLVTATREKAYGASLQADIELGDHTLTSISSYRVWDNNEIRDGDFLDRAYVGLNQLHDVGPQKADTFTQELRIASPTGKTIEYVAGLYYSRADSDRTFSRSVITCSASTLPAVAPGLVPCSTAPGVSTITQPFGSADFGSVFKNFAVFGQATFNISDRFRFIGGLRYTNDKLNVDHIRRTTLAGPGINGNFDAGVFNNGQVAPGGGFVAGPSNGIPFTASNKNDNLSGKAALQFDFSDDVTGYASYTRGYKGPAYNIFFNLGSVGTGLIDEENVDAYEAGLKTQFGAATINAAVYYAKYTGYQANNPDIVAGQVVTRLTNAGSVSTRGFEVDFVLRPARNFSVSGGVAYSDAQVENFRLPPGGNPTQLIAKGTPLANAPKWKLALGADWTIETGGFANIELGSQMALQSDQIYELSPVLATRLGTTVDGYAIVDLNVALVDTNDRWKISATVKNLFDKSFASSIVSGGPGGAFRYIIPREADRYFGVTARVNFGGN